MNISTHFTLEEMTRSQTASRKGISNGPDVDSLNRLRLLCEHVLEPVRTLLGHPIHITSGYRSPQLNTAIGGTNRSQHCHGQAADFVCPGFGTAKEVAQAIFDSNIPYDQLIYEGTWIHISYSKEPRKNVLTAIFDDGKTAYRSGIV